MYSRIMKRMYSASGSTAFAVAGLFAVFLTWYHG